MRLLIINYEMNEDSDVLAWQASVVCQLAKYCEQIIVLTEKTGNFSPLKNVEIYPIPRRPWGVPKLFGSRFLMSFHVAKLIKENHLDACFIHMAMEWVIFLAPALKILRIPILLWYAHGTVTTRLRIAHALTDCVITSTPEGFRLSSTKLQVIGQGIDTNTFNIQKQNLSKNDIIYIGRISPRKRIHLLVDVFLAIKKNNPDLPLKLKLIGPTLSDGDASYWSELKNRIDSEKDGDQIVYIGAITPTQTPANYQTAFVHLNLSQTGSMDKTVLEALACGCPVITSNEAFFNLFSKHPEFLLPNDDIDTIAKKILVLYKNNEQYKPEALRDLIVGKHDVQNYTTQVYKILQTLTGLDK